MNWEATIAGPVLVACLAAGAGVARAAAPATARPPRVAVSSNWAGYVVTARDLRGRSPTFAGVGGRWRLPAPDCGSTAVVGPAASVLWVGLGGNHPGLGALEQVGTAVDCSATGVPRAFAWYELAPGPWVHVALALVPGDVISASVRVAGSRVTLALRDLSRDRGWVETLRDAAPGTLSAEWIVEAPSLCTSIAFCGEQRLTDFGVVRFSDALAESDGRWGAIDDPRWRPTRVVLREGGEPFGGLAPEQHSAAAVPGELGESGETFAVSWYARG